MKKTIISLIISAALIALISGCYYDNQDELYNLNVNSSQNCDTTNVTYSGAIQQLISNNCLGCHGTTNASTGGGVSLQSSSDIQNAIANKNLVNAVSGSNATMPKGGSPLGSCQVNDILAWIHQGYH